MKVKKVANGNYYIINTGKQRKERKFRSWFLIKYSHNKHSDKGALSLGNVSFPPELVGKRITIKIELEEDDKKKSI